MGQLELEIHSRELPPEVEALREEVTEEHQRLDAALQPNIDARIEPHAQEVERVIAIHRDIGDRTDLEIRDFEVVLDSSDERRERRRVAAMHGVPQSVTTDRRGRWEAYLTEDEPPELAFFCPSCAERECGGD